VLSIPTNPVSMLAFPRAEPVRAGSGMGFAIECAHNGSRIALRGDCQMVDLPRLEGAMATAIAVGAPAIDLDLADAGEFDLGPAWLLQRFVTERRAAGVQVTVHGPESEHDAFFGQILARAPPQDAAPPAEPGWLARIGLRLHRIWVEALVALAFGGRVLDTAARALRSVRRLRIPAIVRHLHETGVQAIPVVGTIAMLISVIIAYIGAQQLKPLGAEAYTVDLVVVGVLREMGVLLTAIMVAGRTGSAYAAEIGVMKLNEEVDALEAMGMSAFEVLVLPRVIALVIAMPLLTIVADTLGILGGGLLTRFLLDMSWPQFINRVDAAIAPTTFWAGMVKAPVFGAIIALTGTLRGLQVQDSSRELGRLTTVAVVQSIFLVIFADALFAIFFLEIDF
jgi:phospholipid/cholesterol/gamma-HCH transport system permease protein